MGHYRRVHGKLEFARTSFKEVSTAESTIAVDDLKKGQTVKISGRAHKYLGDTKDADGQVHHFQNHQSGKYVSYHANSVPEMQSRDAMEQGSNKSDCNKT
jgi:hypothetical protein